MNAAVALTADVSTHVEFFFTKTPSEAFTAVHFTGDQVMKGKSHKPLAASAGRSLFLLSHEELVTPRRQLPRQ